MKKTAVPATELQLSLLGSFELRMKDLVLDESVNRSVKMWELLAYLIMNRTRKVPQSELIDLLWPDGDGGNPLNSLKTLLYRTRTTIAKELGPELPLILSQRGAYSWNPDIPCTIDAEEFESICKEAADASRDRRMELFRQAVLLYQGDFLARHPDNLWAVTLSAHYHGLYVSISKELAALLMEDGQYEELTALAVNALRLEPYDEEFHSFLVLGHLRQGNVTAALNHYKNATDQLYRNLGVTPSESLRAVYLEIMKERGMPENDLSVIQQELAEPTENTGAFVCELGFFKEVYRLEARLAARDGTCAHLALVSVSSPAGDAPSAALLSSTMENLLDVMKRCLRKSDVISRYSSNQYILMLRTANYEDGELVMKRLLTAFHTKYPRSPLRVNFKLHPIDVKL